MTACVISQRTATMNHVGDNNHSPITYRRRVMGSTGSLLNENLFQKDVNSSYHSATTDFVIERRSKQLLEDLAFPPKITPFSGRLEKPKQQRLIKPIAVRPISPPSPVNTSHHSDKRHLDSPALSDTATLYQQPPDVILTNQRRGVPSPSSYMPGGNHFSRPPTKTVSLQELPPSGAHHSSGNSSGHLSEPRNKSHKKLQPASSLNVIDQSSRRNNQPIPRQPLFERRERSFSHSSIHDKHLDSYHSYYNNNNGLSRVSSSDFNGFREDQNTPINPILEEAVFDNRDDEKTSRIKELENQIVSLRSTMEQNESSILQVQEEKRREWDSEVRRLKQEMDEQARASEQMEEALQSQLLRLEQDNSRLRSVVDQLKEEACNMKNNSSHQSKSDENANMLFAHGSKRTKKTIEEKNNEIFTLKDKLHHSEKQLIQEKDKVKRLEQELESMRQNKRQQTPDLVKKQNSCRDEEVVRLKSNLSQLNEVKSNLSKQISLQDDEIQVLHRKLLSREKELAQEKSEVAYLRDVQEKLQGKLEESEREFKEFKLKNPGLSKVPELECKLRDKERDLERALEEVKQMEIEKSTEVVQLQKQILRKESEVLHLQSQLGEISSDLKNSGRNKQRRSFKDMLDSKATQKQMEQDYIAMQVKLTKREQELFQMKRELTTIRDGSREDKERLQRKVVAIDTELKMCKEKIQLKDEEFSLLQEKFHDREKEIASLYDKLERLNPNARLKEENSLERDKDSEIRELTDENTYLREKLNRMSMGVKALSSSQMNLADKSSNGMESDEVGRLQKELHDLKGKMEKQTYHFEEERKVWQTEKSQVLSYQKQLHLNYMQMGQKNKKLEREVQQLTAELDREDVIHC